MTLWNTFIYFAIAAVIAWAAGALFAWRGKKKLAIGVTAAGLSVFFAYVLTMWITLERPPLRTMGETRLWYALLLPFAGLMVYLRHGYRWILSFTTLLATVFVCINIFKPEIHEKTLMPALQSPWFAPHVIVYMLSYALLGAATLIAFYALIFPKRIDQGEKNLSRSTQEIVSVGWSFLTVGMLFGALWAKEAWGHYWTWDPKETWAAVTWLAYLVFIHWRGANRLRYYWLLVCFVLLQMCWWGINYLPSAQGMSVHTYG